MGTGADGCGRVRMGAHTLFADQLWLQIGCLSAFLSMLHLVRLCIDWVLAGFLCGARLRQTHSGRTPWVKVALMSP